MTSTPAPILAPARRLPIEWRRAWRALRALIAHPERTDLAFEVTLALSGSSGERLLQRFLAHPEGQILFAERPALLRVLSDRAALAAMPTGSFGRAYLEFMRSADLTADGLVEVSETPQRATDLQPDPDREWFFDRLRDMHDLWHVLTGYGRDEAGEAANLAFSYAQIGNPGAWG